MLLLPDRRRGPERKSTPLNSNHQIISYSLFFFKSPGPPGTLPPPPPPPSPPPPAVAAVGQAHHVVQRLFPVGRPPDLRVEQEADHRPLHVVADSLGPAAYPGHAARPG